MTDAPLPQADLERHPRTQITRLPYVVVALIALLIAGFWGAVTMPARQTAQQEMIGPNATPNAVSSHAVESGPPR